MPNDPEMWRDRLAKSGPQHKYDYGHALIAAGGLTHAGAARLAAQAALRVGSGLVTLALPGGAMIAKGGPDALIKRRIDTGADLTAALGDSRITALCLGPGLGTDRARDLMVAALQAEYGPAITLDADALTAFAEDPAALFALSRRRPVVMTPHAGEFGRLFGDLDAAAASDKAGCTVILKGVPTTIAHRGAEVARIDTGAAPWLATAGSGDVLAGIVTGLLARGLPPVEAAQAAVHLHTAAAIRFGPGLIADDLPEQLPGVFRDLGL